MASTAIAAEVDTAGTWQRVSTGGQDEASQLPDLDGWCNTHSYPIKRRYVLHGKSASKGKQDKYLDRVIRDMEDGVIKVLVVWQSSRIERRGAYNVFDLARRVREAGGRIEYVQDEYLNATNEMSDVMLALAATKDRMKSADISKQVIAKQAALRAAGSVVGRPAWGYEIGIAGGRKIFVPTADGRKYVPIIFDMVTGNADDNRPGYTLREVAEYLTAERVATTQDGYVVIGPLRPWNEGYIGNRMIKNPIYHGERRNGGQLETEALVTYSAWQAANAALATRIRTGRGTVAHAKPLARPTCGNPACDATGPKPSPMYRVFTGAGANRVAYYRCTGRGPQRKGCGNMVPLAKLDKAVADAMAADQMNMRTERLFIAGDDDRAEVAKLRGLAMEAYARGDKATFVELDTQADSLDSPSTLPHWERRETGQTEGEYFAALDDEGKRDELAQCWDITATADSIGVVRKSVTLALAA